MVLYLSLKVIGESQVGKSALATVLSVTAGDKENEQAESARRQPTEVKVRVGGRRCKLDQLTPNVANKFITNASWSKVNGFIFMYDMSEPDSVESIMQTVSLLKQQPTLAQLPSILLANKCDTTSSFTTTQVREFCSSNNIDLFEVSCAPLSPQAKQEEQERRTEVVEVVSAFVASVANTLPAESPKKSRRRSLKPTSFKNDITHQFHNAVAAVPSLSLSSSSGPSDTESPSGSITPKSKSDKKNRRRSILGGMKTPRSRRKERKRRETLMGNLTESDSSCSDSSDGEYSDSDVPTSASIETMDGSHKLDELMEYILFSARGGDVRDRFFMTYWKFATGQEVLGCLRRFWRGYPQPLPGNKQRVATFLVAWVRSAPACDGFMEDQELIKELEMFEKNVSACKEVSRPDELSCELAKLPALAPSATSDATLNADPVEALGLHRKYKPIILAQQLTMLHSNSLLQVKPYEMLRKVSSSSTPADYPNLSKMITQSTSLSHWVSREVLQENDVKERSKAIRYFIDVAWTCKELMNFNAVMAITGALGSSPISRLHATWEEVGRTHSKKLLQLTNMMLSHNHREYRRLITTALPPCVPFPGIWITDLVKIHETSSWSHVIDAPEVDGEAEKVDLVNLGKMKLVTDVLRQLQRFQEPGCCYGFEPNRELQAILRNLPSMDEDEAWARSYELESSKSVGSLNLALDGASGEDLNSFQAYSLATSYSGSLSSKALSDILDKEAIDMELLTKLQQRARAAANTNDRVALLNKWVAKGATDRVFQETLAASDACDVLLASIMCYSGVFTPAGDENSEEQLNSAQMAALNQAISSMFHTLVVGDKENMQQLLTLMKTTLVVCEREVAGRHIRQLFSCYKFPQHYRTIHSAIKERRAEIAKLNVQLESKDQSSFKEESTKEAAKQRKVIEATKDIVQLYVEIEQLIALKEEKKLAMCSKYRNVMATIRADISAIRNKTTQTIGDFSSSLEKIRELESKNASSYRRTASGLDEKSNAVAAEMAECTASIAALEAKLKQERERLQGLQKQQASIEKKKNRCKASYLETKTQLTQDAKGVCDNLSGDQGTSQALRVIQKSLQKLDRYLVTVIGLEQHQLDQAIRGSRLCSLTHSDSIVHGTKASELAKTKSLGEVVLTEPQREQHTETMAAEERFYSEVADALLQLEGEGQQLLSEMSATVSNLSLLNSSGLQQKMLKGEFNFVKHLEKAKCLKKRLRLANKDSEALNALIDADMLHNSGVSNAKRCETLLYNLQQILRSCAKTETTIEAEIAKSQ